MEDEFQGAFDIEGIKKKYDNTPMGEKREIFKRKMREHMSLGHTIYTL